jgi:PKD domain
MPSPVRTRRAREPRLVSRLLLPLLAALALALVGAAPALAASAWIAPPEKLSEAGQNASAQQIALDARGDAVAIWQRLDGANLIVESARRPAGAAGWSAPQRLSAAGQDAGEPQVAVTPAGDAVAVWERSDGAHSIIESASLPAGAGAWSMAEPLSAPGQSAATAQIALDGRGDAVAVWRRFDGTRFIVEAATRPAGAPEWSKPQALSEPGQNAFVPQVALDDGGDAVAVWERSDGANFIVESATRPATADTWSKPQALSEPGQNASFPEVALDGRGDAVAVWERLDGARPIAHLIVESSSLPLGAAMWSKAQPLSEPGQNASFPELALDGQGDAVAVWERSDGAQPTSHTIVESAGLPAGANAWSSPQKLSEPGQNAVVAQLAVDRNGDAVAVWTRVDGAQPTPSLIAEGASLPAGTAKWSSSRKLSEAGQDAAEPEVAIDDGGDAVAVWTRLDGAQPAPHTIVESDIFDATPPTLGALNAPRTGFAGQRLSFSAAAADAFSAVRVDWSFGDGGSASASKAAHAFRKPGSYQVAVAVADVPANRVTGAARVDVWQLSVLPRTALRRGQALLPVRCLGAGLCRGTLTLRAAKPHALLGRARFSLRAGKRRTLRVKLGAKAKRALRRAPRRGLAVRVRGAGVKGGTVRLRSPRR